MPFLSLTGTRSKILMPGLAAVLFLAGCRDSPSSLDRTATLFAPCLEWRLVNESCSGNPYDLTARVTFTHDSSAESRVTEMFYDGNGIWKFRFTGVRTGEWRFRTESDDPDLDGFTGRILVRENPDPTVTGFLGHRGNRYAVQSGPGGEVAPFRFAVFMDGHTVKTFIGDFQGEFIQKPYSSSPLFQLKDEAKRELFFTNLDENGFEIGFIHVGYPHIWTDGSTVTNGVNPRIETFELLETLIREAHARGFRLHIWMWGDDQRRATPRQFSRGGINGEVDRRLLRYLAARLGPLPGWSMGYGFDLHEWTNPEQVNEWAAALHRHFGWDHLLSARGFYLEGGNNINAYDGFGRDVPLKTSRGGPRDYGEVLEDMRSDLSRPHLYEERHTYLRPGFDLDMDGTRRLIWWQMMAGGMGGWFGFYPDSPHPYPHPGQLRCARRFFNEQFRIDMEPANELTDGLALCTPDHSFYIFYRQEAKSIRMNLSAMPQPKPAKAVDAAAPYRAIDLGILNPGRRSWIAPYISDWAVAVGDFESHSNVEKEEE